MITRHGIKMEKFEDGIYYDESRVQVPSGIAPPDDARKAEFQKGYNPEPIKMMAKKTSCSDLICRKLWAYMRVCKNY